ncbi:hypothetical protein BDK51DRAFT_38173 [Blyttiomyces helicus]|uniref:Uncharacterized protein n=1 Tax=Blyttiomyces helicus TaxID=388810 RepID=A0A4P9WHF5_9FUNG|nr:hypothetical protein BDK51DRAFT_38173 [Blyttiomyces helicus]|eukprot:RKO92164.1 hypothetical protein BDK51DRAFT_38173 [Blyttiomyces helicus]
MLPTRYRLLQLPRAFDVMNFFFVLILSNAGTKCLTFRWDANAGAASLPEPTPRCVEGELRGTVPQPGSEGGSYTLVGANADLSFPTFTSPRRHGSGDIVPPSPVCPILPRFVYSHEEAVNRICGKSSLMRTGDTNPAPGAINIKHSFDGSNSGFLCMGHGPSYFAPPKVSQGVSTKISEHPLDANEGITSEPQTPGSWFPAPDAWKASKHIADNVPFILRSWMEATVHQGVGVARCTVQPLLTCACPYSVF